METLSSVENSTKRNQHIQAQLKFKITSFRLSIIFSTFIGTSGKSLQRIIQGTSRVFEVSTVLISLALKNGMHQRI